MKIRWRFIVMVTLATALSTAFSQVLFASVPPQVGGDWTIDLRTVAAVAGVVIVGTWRLGRWMKQIDDRLDQGEKRFGEIAASMSARDLTLASMKQKIDSLPCTVCSDQVTKKLSNKKLP